jgi:hypothetical protein
MTVMEIDTDEIEEVQTILSIIAGIAAIAAGVFTAAGSSTGAGVSGGVGGVVGIFIGLLSLFAEDDGVGSVVVGYSVVDLQLLGQETKFSATVGSSDDTGKYKLGYAIKMTTWPD